MSNIINSFLNEKQQKAKEIREKEENILVQTLE